MRHACIGFRAIEQFLVQQFGDYALCYYSLLLSSCRGCMATLNRWRWM